LAATLPGLFELVSQIPEHRSVAIGVSNFSALFGYVSINLHAQVLGFIVSLLLKLVPVLNASLNNDPDKTGDYGQRGPRE